MREEVVLRLRREFLHRIRSLTPIVGKPIGDWGVEVQVPTDSALHADIRRAYQQLQAETGEDLHFWWFYKRRYSPGEIGAAEVLNLKLMGSTNFEPAGEECGTTYDESTSCPHCGVGRTQTSDLTLDLRKVPSGKDIVKTIADEWLISDRLVRCCVELGLKGFELRPIHHFQKARKLLPIWHQLVIPPAEERVQILSLSRFGNGPFDDDLAGEYRCPLGHVLGLRALSELYLKRATWERLGRDIVFTREMRGYKAGLLRPEPFILISPRFYRLLKKENVKALRFEVAYLDGRCREHS